MAPAWLPSLSPAVKRSGERGITPPGKRPCPETRLAPQRVEASSIKRLPPELLCEIASHLGAEDLRSFGLSRARHGAVLEPAPLRRLLHDLSYALAPPAENVAASSNQAALLRGALEGEHRIDRSVLALWPPKMADVQVVDGAKLTGAHKTHLCGHLLLARHQMPVTGSEPSLHHFFYLFLGSKDASWRELPIEREQMLDWVIDSHGQRLVTLTQAAADQTVRLIEFFPHQAAVVVGHFPGLALSRLSLIGKRHAVLGIPPLQGTEFLRFEWPGHNQWPARISSRLTLPAAGFSHNHVFSPDGRFVAFQMLEPYVHIHDISSNISFVHNLPARLRDGVRLHFSSDGCQLLEQNAHGLAYVLTFTGRPDCMWQCDPFGVIGGLKTSSPRVLSVFGDEILYMAYQPSYVAYGIARHDGCPVGALFTHHYSFARRHTLVLRPNRMVHVRLDDANDGAPPQCGFIDFSKGRPRLVWPIGPEHPGRAWELVLFDAEGNARHIVHRQSDNASTWRSQLFAVPASNTLSLPAESFAMPPGLFRLRMTASTDDSKMLVEFGELPWDVPPLMAEKHRHTKAFVISWRSKAEGGVSRR